MLYNPPSGAATANDSYVGKNVQAGQQGSKIPRAAIEFTQREIVNAIIAAGLSPTNDDLFQLTRVIRGGQLDFAVDTGTTDAMVVAVTLTHIQVKAGLPFTFIKGAAANATAAPKLTITGPAGVGPLAQPLVKANGSALLAGDLPAGAMIMVRSDGTNFRVVSLALASDILSSILANQQQSFISGGRFITFSSASGTWTVPANVFTIRVTMNGGGGGGGGALSTSGNAGGSGGGGGQYAEGTFTVTPGQVLPFVVGAGGAGGTGTVPGNGTAGGTSSLGGLISAAGGAGGAAGANSNQNTAAGAGGTGGSAGASGRLISGTNGGYSVPYTTSLSQGGLGGASPFGGPSPGPNANAPGQQGIAPGGGANGGACGSSGNAAGGYGANGQITIIY